MNDLYAHMPFAVVEVGLALLGVGLSLVAGMLLKPKPKSGLADKEPTTLTTRGSVLPRILGRRRTGPLFGWAGDRSSKSDSGRGGKGLFGGATAKQKVFYEVGWHQLTVGPAYGIYQIWQDGKPILPAPIFAGSNPSGTTVSCGDEGDFDIYWGEALQPVNTLLADVSRVGVASRWPRVCYVVWNKKRLGPSPRWPVLEYDIEVRGTCTAVGGGINLADAFRELVHGTYPYGAGIPTDRFDQPSITALASLCSSEGLAGSVVARDGDTLDKIIPQLMQDVGFFMPSVDGKVRLVPIRPPNDAMPILSDDILLPPRNEIEQVLGETAIDNLVFMFTDRGHDYRPNTVTDSNTAAQISANTKSSRKVDIYSTVEYVTAAKIADRRSAEELGGAVKYRLIANRQSRTLYPGQVILAHEIRTKLRLTSVKPQALSGRVDIDAVADFYGVLPSSFTQEVPPTSPANSLGPQADEVDLVLAVPPYVPSISNGNSPPPIISISVPRIRKHAQILGAEIWASVDNITYFQVGLDAGERPGGVLIDALPPGMFSVAEGPRIALRGPDTTNALDLSSSESEWRRGRQILVIGDEIIYIEKLTLIDAATARLDGLLRARLGTTQGNHAAGAKAVICNWQTLVTLNDPSFTPGRTIYVKVRPFSFIGAMSLASLSPVIYVIPLEQPGGALNFRTERISGYTNVYDSAAPTLKLLWRYRSTVYPETGAGLEDASEAVVAPSPPMGTFTIEELNAMDVVLRTWTGLTTTELLVNVPTMIADYGGVAPASARFRIKEVIGGDESAWQTIDVAKIN